MKAQYIKPTLIIRGVVETERPLATSQISMYGDAATVIHQDATDYIEGAKRNKMWEDDEDYDDGDDNNSGYNWPSH